MKKSQSVAATTQRDRDVRAIWKIIQSSHYKMLSQKIMHMLKKNEKIESFSKERDLKKNQMEILELKKYNNWNES